LKEETIELKEYYVAIRRHIFGIVLFSILMALLTAYLLQFVPNVYKANSSIFIETKESNVVSIEGMYQVDMSENEYFNTQLSILKSRSLAEKVFNELQLNKHDKFIQEKSKAITFLLNVKSLLPNFIISIFNDKQGKNTVLDKNDPKLIEQQAINRLMNQIHVSQIEKSNLIKISFETQSLDIVDTVPNTYAKLYIERGLNLKSKDNNQAKKQLKERVTGLKTKLLDAENRLIEYKNNNNLLDIDGVTTFEEKNLEITSQRLLEARKERNEIEIVFSQINEANTPSIEHYESMPSIMDKASVQNARQLSLTSQAKVIELSKKYGIKHPKIQSALSQYKKARINYAQLLKGVRTGIRNKYRAASLYEKSLQLDLDSIKNNIKKINNKSHQLRIYEKEVEENQKLHETFSTRYKEAKETSSMITANATIFDKAVPPGNHFFPKRVLLIVIAATVSFFLSILVALVFESLEKTFRFPEEIIKYLDVPFLGMLPFLKVKSKKTKQITLPYLEDKRSLYAESIRTIRTGILLSLMKQDKKVVIVTSSIPSEGKTTASLNLAIAMGHTQSVLLVDTDLRKSSVGKKCGIDTDIGLSTVLDGTSQLEESIHVFEEWNIDVLPGGKISNHPQEQLCSDKFSKLIDSLKSKYDMIIIDSAPIAPVADTLLITKEIKNIVFFVKADLTSRSMARSSIDKLKSIDANIIGVVLNGLDTKKASKYRADDYYSGYYNDYGYNS
jgi:polysaccharide biosynthesis transport protein